MFTEKTHFCLYSRAKGYFVNKTVSNVVVGYMFNDIHEFDYESIRIFKKYEEREARDLVKSLKKDTPDLMLVTIKTVIYPSEED